MGQGRKSKVTKTSVAKELNFPREKNNQFVPLFPCDISALIGSGELEDNNEIMLDFGLRKNLAYQG